DHRERAAEDPESGLRLGARQSRAAARDMAGVERMSRSEIVRTIIAAKAKPPATLALKWSDRTRADGRLSAMLRARGFRALRNATKFAAVRVGEWGHSVEWSSGAELSAETLWLETLSATGRQDTRAFLVWRLRHGLSLTKAAEALGVSRRM